MHVVSNLRHSAAAGEQSITPEGARLGGANRWLERIQRAREARLHSQRESTLVVGWPRARIHACGAPSLVPSQTMVAGNLSRRGTLRSVGSLPRWVRLSIQPTLFAVQGPVVPQATGTGCHHKPCFL